MISSCLCLQWFNSKNKPEQTFWVKTINHTSSAGLRHRAKVAKFQKKINLKGNYSEVLWVIQLPRSRLCITSIMLTAVMLTRAFLWWAKGLTCYTGSQKSTQSRVYGALKTIIMWFCLLGSWARIMRVLFGLFFVLKINYFLSHNISWLQFTIPLLLPIPLYLPSHLYTFSFCLSLKNRFSKGNNKIKYSKTNQK